MTNDKKDYFCKPKQKHIVPNKDTFTMKKYTMIVAALLLTLPMFAERVSTETARKVATTFLNNNDTKADQLIDVTKAAGFANLYIFTTEKSFVIMAADDCVQPVLGYSLTGSFVAENIPENVQGWLLGYNEEIQFAIDNRMKASSETSQLWNDLIAGNSKAGRATAVVEPLIQTRWNQTQYYNLYCPAVSDGPDGRAYTGCVATAMAQIMKYWNYPASGIGSHSYTWNNQTLSADFGSTSYDWNNMSNTYNYNSAIEKKLAVSTLMYHCGVSVDMVYGGQSTGGSSASTAQVGEALKTYFNYSSEIVYKTKANYPNDWETMVKNELDADRPLQYRGRSSGGGHSFVCDGYNSDNKFHFNWGWSGAYDGYFSLDNLNTGANNQSGQGNGTYTDDQAALFGIQPVQCAASDPTDLIYSLIGLQSLTLNWTAANGAASYNIYRNNNFIGNTTTNSYTETAPFGANVYYVRSVDANGKLSLSSNAVSLYIGYQTPAVDDLEASLDGDDVQLSWTAPEWCYPETESAKLNYGEGSPYYSWSYVYYAHRHLAANLAQYAGKAVYKISTYIKYPGTYSVYIYTKSTQYNKPDPNSLAFSNTEVPVTISSDWYEFDTDSPIFLTGTDDLWVVIKQENTGQEYPTPSFNLSEHNINAFYASSSSPTNLNDANSGLNCAWFINTYLTDGTYTYNLYQDGTRIVSDLTGISYSGITLNDNAANQFVVKTNYYGGEAPSNMLGYAKGSASLATLNMGTNDKMTLTGNSILTVSGDVINTNPDNLILENGAQLIHNTADVQATVKKDITAYSSDEDGWYFIASPVTENITPSADNGLLTNDYDLYMFDQSQDQEWRNIEASSFSTIDHKTGYLYANSGNTTIDFAGILAASTTATNLVYDGDARLKGFNLIGNPYPCNTTIEGDFYVISGNTVMLAEDGAVIAPCEGIFVKATAAGQNVTFNKAASSKGNNSKDCFDLVVTQGKANVDRARVRLNEGIGMEKLSLNDKHSQISLQQNGQDFAVAYTNGATEMPVSFIAEKNGTYTLTIEAQHLDMDYLHLIDNLTGNDVDLLATPSYTFEAKISDYPSRFKLVFSNCEDAVGDNATFAYVNNGNIIINTEGILQIVDMTGRMIYQGDAKHCVSTTEMVSGVYVLRLITTEGVKTQKMVIE